MQIVRKDTHSKPCTNVLGNQATVKVGTVFNQSKPNYYRFTLHNIVQQKAYKNILCEYNFKFSDNTPATTHQHFPNYCCSHTLVYVVASNTTSVLFTSHLFRTQCDLLN